MVLNKINISEHLLGGTVKFLKSKYRSNYVSDLLPLCRRFTKNPRNDLTTTQSSNLVLTSVSLSFREETRKAFKVGS